MKGVKVKFTLTCNAKNPSPECRKVKKFDLPQDEMDDLVAAFAERNGLCTPCFNAGAQPKPKAHRSGVVVKSYDPDEMITVTCWNRKCKSGTAVVEALVRDGETIREAKTYAVAAKVRVKRSEANGALCEVCAAEAKK